MTGARESKGGGGDEANGGAGGGGAPPPPRTHAVRAFAFCGTLLFASDVLNFIYAEFLRQHPKSGNIILFLQFFLRNSGLRSCFWLTESKPSSAFFLAFGGFTNHSTCAVRRGAARLESPTPPRGLLRACTTLYAPPQRAAPLSRAPAPRPPATALNHNPPPLHTPRTHTPSQVFKAPKGRQGGPWQEKKWWLRAVGSGWRLAVGRRWRLVAVGG